MQKGQAALEFMFIILIVIIYLSTVVIPLTKDSKNAITDIDALAKANNETQKIINAIERVSTFGEGTKETLTILLPSNSTINCSDKNISFQTVLTAKPYPAQCTSGSCNKSYSIPQSQTLDCKLPTIIGPVKTKIVIEKSNGNKVIFTQGI
ncbi:MAG: hypothetical protein WCW44_00605 [archaeon]